MPPRRGEHDLAAARSLAALLSEIDRVEADDRLLLSVVEELEILLLEPANRLAVAVHDAHRDLDENDLGGLADGGPRGVGPGRLAGGLRHCRRGNEGEEKDEEDGANRQFPCHGTTSGKGIPPDPARSHDLPAGSARRSRRASAIWAE